MNDNIKLIIINYNLHPSITCFSNTQKSVHLRERDTYFRKNTYVNICIYKIIYNI